MHAACTVRSELRWVFNIMPYVSYKCRASIHACSKYFFGFMLGWQPQTCHRRPSPLCPGWRLSRTSELSCKLKTTHELVLAVAATTLDAHSRQANTAVTLAVAAMSAASTVEAQVILV